MTRAVILAMPAGRAPDCLVAENVCGHKNVRLVPDHVWTALRDPTEREVFYYAQYGVRHEFMGMADIERQRRSTSANLHTNPKQEDRRWARARKGARKRAPWAFGCR